MDSTIITIFLLYLKTKLRVVQTKFQSKEREIHLQSAEWAGQMYAFESTEGFKCLYN